MSSLDLPEIRARLAANGRDRRQCGGALRALRTLLSNQPPRPLLSPTGEPPKGPAARPPSPELELLGSDAEPPFELEVRRTTFGRRAEPAPLEDESAPLLLTLAVSAPPAVPALTFRPQRPCEDELPPAEAVQEQPSPEQPDTRKLLESLEDRLRREQHALERRLAGR
jgi:hypothetical protein